MMTPANTRQSNFKLYHFAYIALAVCMMVIGVVCFWLVWPYDPLTINSIFVEDKELVQGEPIYYTIDYCKKESSVPRVQHQLVDHLIYNMPIEYGPLANGCHKTLMVLPLGSVPVGKYRLHETRVYRVNILRFVTVEAESNEFAIIRRVALAQ